MTSGFEAEADVGAGDDDGFLVEAGLGYRRGDEELAVEEAAQHGIWDAQHGFEVGGGVDVVERFVYLVGKRLQ